jgi:cysteinyl-tRNA synthetase
MSLPKIMLTNTLGGKKEEFKALEPGKVTLYACGPTVYGKIHVGNAMAALVSDLVTRVFRLAGYQVEWASNITDVDDKIIKAANDEKISAQEIAARFTEIYLNEMKELNVQSPTHRPKATESIPDMLSMIESLIEKGFAYSAETPFGKDVYFRVRKFKNYGKLSNKNLDDLQTGARIEPGESKEDGLDFALWKAAKPGEPSWISPWGEGRPGWHIECSAMIHKHFPAGIDIHMGGLDLIFPHHENEIAQSEACLDHKFARYWIHNNLLTIEREKMSKSLGNIFTAEEFLKNYGAEVLRLFIYQHHYRSPIDFSEENLCRTEALLSKLYAAKKKAFEVLGSLNPQSLEKVPEIETALYDDFNTAKALGIIMKNLREAFKQNTPESWKAWAPALKYFSEVYGILEKDPNSVIAEIHNRKLKRLGITEARAQEIESKLEERVRLRAQKDFATADKIRKELEDSGVLVMDGAENSTWSLKSGLS